MASNNQKSFKIAVIPGDGIGPEVTGEAVKVLEVVAGKKGYQFEFKNLLAGGEAWDKYGLHLPKETLQACHKSDAILFGAVGGPVDKAMEPKWLGVEKTVILGLREEFDLFANIRPVKGTDIDFVIVRELTSGIYFGNKKGAHLVKSEMITDKETIDILYYSYDEVKRILEVGFKLARQRQKRLTVVDKANVLNSSKFWRKVVEETKLDYPEVKVNYMFVDNAAYQLAKQPDQFDVIVTSNMFGDILSDEAAIWVKSLGMMPSASLGQGSFGMYEPAHGSAPKLTGQGTANPLATILSAAFMLRFSFGLEEGAVLIEESVNQVLKNGYGTPDLEPENIVTTDELGELIVSSIK